MINDGGGFIAERELFSVALKREKLVSPDGQAEGDDDESEVISGREMFPFG